MRKLKSQSEIEAEASSQGLKLLTLFVRWVPGLPGPTRAEFTSVIQAALDATFSMSLVKADALYKVQFVDRAALRKLQSLDSWVAIRGGFRVDWMDLKAYVENAA